jgi:hypothetical protein
LDYKEQKANLHPIPQQKEDYVQSELRRLRDNLQTESSKMRRPRQFSFLSISEYLIISFFLCIVKLMNHLFTMI